MKISLADPMVTSDALSMTDVVDRWIKIVLMMMM